MPWLAAMHSSGIMHEGYPPARLDLGYVVACARVPMPRLHPPSNNPPKNSNQCRKIKRSTKRSAGATDSCDGSDDSDGDDLDAGDEPDNDDDAGTEVCPPGCEQVLYERVCDLREQRLDEDDAAADVAREAEGLRKEHDVLSKKGRLIEQGLSAIHQV